MSCNLSIIVPIFKVEPYLCKCLDSLLLQGLSLKDYEIILVDDGSPDACPIIADLYAQKYENVKVIHRQNGGLSAARNSGIKEAKGKYVQFVDSDDYLEPNILKGLVEKMERDQLDVLRFNYRNVNEHYEIIEPNRVSRPFMYYEDAICDGLTFLTERLGFACYAVQFIIRRSLLENCLFKEGIYFEDAEWTPRLLLNAKRVTSTNKHVYNYLIRTDSITQSKERKDKFKALEDRFSLIDSMQSQMKCIKDTRWHRGFIAQLSISIISDISSYFYDDRRALIQSLEKKDLFPLYPYHSTIYVKRKACIANVSPLLLCWFLHMKNK